MTVMVERQINDMIFPGISVPSTDGDPDLRYYAIDGDERSLAGFLVSEVQLRARTARDMASKLTNAIISYCESVGGPA